MIISKEYFALASALVALIAFLYSLSKDRNQKKREYADKIRTSAATVLAKLERHKELSNSMFHNIQSAFVDTDAMIIETHSFNDNSKREVNVLKARDFLWKELVKENSAVLDKIVQEQIEMAYVGLYGYLPEVRHVFSDAVTSLKIIHLNIAEELRRQTQENIMEFLIYEGEIPSAELGNKLRDTCSEISDLCFKQMTIVIDKFRDEMFKIVNATDNKIFKKKIEINRIELDIGLTKTGLFIPKTDYWLSCVDSPLDKQDDISITEGMSSIISRELHQSHKCVDALNNR